jgi:3-polyprenyl-4-hydroxybenzoate decarboxylase
VQSEDTGGNSNGYDNDLIIRAAVAALKERGRLMLAARETLLSSIHLERR